jgi:hypothetical protein
MKLRSLRRTHPPWSASRPVLGAAFVALCVALPLSGQAQSALPVTARVQAGSEANLLVLEVDLDGHVLSDSLGAYQEGAHILLPLGELSRLLTLAINVHPVQGRASGFVIHEDHEFSLDVGTSTATVNGHETSFEPSLASVIGDDIYVSSQLLSRWLPLDLKVDLSRLQLRVKPRERLPLQERLEREDYGARLHGVAGEVRDLGYPLLMVPFALASVPFIDQTFSSNANLGDQAHENKLLYTGYFTGDLLGMEGAAYVSTNRESQILATGDTTTTPAVRLTLSRHDPDAGLLGPMQARSVAIGSINVPTVPEIMIGSPNGNGLMVSNRPLDQPTSFDRQTLRGNLPPGWDVTLYYNDTLLAYQQSRADGQYAFEDLPLSFGPNDFRLVFNGPLGQVRVERQSFLLDHSIIKPGEIFYSLAQQRDYGGGLRSLAQADFGLTRTLSLNGALVRKPDLITGDEDTYAQMGLRAYVDSMIVSTQLSVQQSGGLLGELDFKTRIAGYSIDFTHLQREGDFHSDTLSNASDAIRFRDLLRVIGTFKPESMPAWTVSLDGLRDQLDAGGQRIDVTGRASTMYKGTAMSTSVSWEQSLGQNTAEGSLQLSRRVMNIGLNGQFGYTLLPHPSLETYSLTADRGLGDAYRINAGFQHTISSPLTQGFVGLTKSLGSFGLGIGGSYNTQHQIAIGVQLFFSLGRDPRTGNWLMDAQSLAGTGAVSVRAFVDRNQNGIRDPGEELIPNAGFIFNGGGRNAARTDADGNAFMGRLMPDQYTDIALDPDTLEDPQWKPLTPGVRVLPRPGVVNMLEFPVVATSEIDGTIFLLETKGRREIGDVHIELVDVNNVVVASTRSSPDGYYLLHQVLPGKYVLRIAPDQALKLSIEGKLDRALTVPPDGDFISGQDFELKLAAH